MTLNQNPLSSETLQQSRRPQLWVGVLAALLFAGFQLVSLLMVSNQVWTALPVFIAVLVVYWLNRAGKQIQAGLTLIAAVCLQIILAPLVQRDLGIPNLIASLALIGILCLTALPRKYFWRTFGGAVLVALASPFIDAFGIPGRPVAEFDLGRWILLFGMLIAFAILLVRESLSLSIRTKIVAGILGTGALALGVFIVFTTTQNQEVTDALSKRLEKSVGALAEEQLQNTASKQADLISKSFEDVTREVVGLAQNWSALEGEKEFVSQRIYWSAKLNLTQWDGGQYGNASDNISAVFAPAGVSIDETLITDLNTSAYLDFYAPRIMEAYPSLVTTVYAVDTRGVIRAYPNKNLASFLPPDFNATQESSYSISTPLFNPQHKARWTIPHKDALTPGSNESVVTVAMPVYDEEDFTGVVAADMKLSGIIEPIKAIKVGETGYAFMIDDSGCILYMPQAGYDMFGIRPEDVDSTEFAKQTLLGLGNADLQIVTRRMVAGASGLLTVKVKIGSEIVDTYISFSPIIANGYSIALVVPKEQLQGEFISASNQTKQQNQSAARAATLIIIVLLALSVVVSVGLGRLIAAPIQRLTLVASRIASGDLSVQAEDRTKDETGTLAHSFNTMTARLRETLDGLERMVAERTGELLSANEKNERRARQFESIAQVARTISSTRDLDNLLAQITTAISREFGFYHIGIFLLDTTKEYAILSAANSEGGQTMLKRGHRLKVGETGIVGYVTRTGIPRVALDTGIDTTFLSSADLPETHSEIALPLRAGEEIIGALDVQSTEPGAFSQEDINILSTLADQVSIAIQNAQQFERTRKALSDAEVLARQFAQTGWQQYTKERNLVGIHHTGARATLLYEKSGKQKEMEQPRKKSRGAFLSLPIELRGEVIGSVDIRSPDNRPWDQDELDIVTAIIERAAISMENARLLEESQRLASKEAKIGSVTAKISSSINMRNVLQTAVEELGRALPGSEVVIQFQTDQNKSKTAS